MILKRILASAFVAVALATAAIAADLGVTFSIRENADITGGYDAVVNFSSPGGKIDGYQVIFSYNNALLFPIDATASSLTQVDVTSGAKNKKKPIVLPEGENLSYEYPTAPIWTVKGNKTTVTIDAYVIATKDEFDEDFDASNFEAMTISFCLADGKTLRDITASDFVVESIFIGDSYNGDWGYNHDNGKYDLTVSNNVVYKSTSLKISVTAGDVVYTQDGKVTTATATGDFEIPSTDGYVTVNTGYTAQKLYKVASGAVTEVTANANGVLGTNDASVRSDSVATGLRFKSSFLTALQNSVKEYGYLVTVESEANALPTGYVLNMALVESGKAKKGIAFAKDDAGNVTTNISFDAIDARTIVTAVATGIPETKTGVNTYIVARPYYVLDGGTVVYGETSRRTIGGVALSIQNAGGEVYTQNKAYVDKIVGLIDDKNAVIDMGNLFAE